jgi:hypothetical protein
MGTAVSGIFIEADGVRWTVDSYIDSYGFMRIPADYDWVDDAGYDLRTFAVPVTILRKDGSLDQGFLDEISLQDAVAWRARDFSGAPYIYDQCFDIISEEQYVEFEDGSGICDFCEEHGEA